MERWEYKTLKFEMKGFINRSVDTEELDNLLNQYGSQGWELMSCLSNLSNGYTTEIIAVMKRKATL